MMPSHRQRGGRRIRAHCDPGARSGVCDRRGGSTRERVASLPSCSAHRPGERRAHVAGGRAERAPCGDRAVALIAVALLLQGPIGCAHDAPTRVDIERLEARLDAERAERSVDVRRLTDEVATLRLEIAEQAGRLKQLSETSDGRGDAGGGPLLEVRPAGMSEKEFIEWHRSYQDERHAGAGGGSMSLRLAYRKLAAAHPDDRAWAYLHERVEPGDAGCSAARALVSRWPDFGYARCVLAHCLAHAASPLDFAAAQREWQTALRFDPELLAMGAGAAYEEAAMAQERAPSLKLASRHGGTGEPWSDYLDTTHITSQRIQVSRYRTSSSGRRETQPEFKFELELRYIGPSRLIQAARVSGASATSGFGFEYEVSVKGDYASLSFELIGASDTGRARKYVSDSDLRIGGGKHRIYLTAEDVLTATELRLQSVM